MSKIGIKNFRVFKEFTEFEIKPITLLTGPNNAGKSSFTKLLLLLKNGLSKLNFNEGLHNLESFDKVLNWENKQDTLALSFDNEIPFLTDDFKVNLLYKNSEVKGISIANNSNYLIELKHLEKERNSHDVYYQKDSYNLNINIAFIIELIYTKQLIQTYYDSKEKQTRDIILNNLVIGNSKASKTTFADLENLFYKENKIETIDFYRTIAFHNEINALEKDYLLYDIIANDEKITHLYNEKIVCR